MISAIVSRLVILLFGTLYPAYASYKAVRTKNVKEYVKWMMYWIVFAFFTFIETFTDILLSWFPFYYEIKVIVVLWLLSPATRGSSTLYRKFVHPMLTRREQEIDDYINQAKEKGYTAVLQLGSKGVNYATNVIMQTAIKVLGTKTDTTPFGSMMRISQSDNSLLMTAAAVAARASAADTFSSGSGPMRTNGLTTNYRDTGTTSGEDEADSGSLMGVQADQQQNSGSLTHATSAGRVRRSQSVDSALNRGGPQQGGSIPRSTTSRSMTRSRAAAGLQQHAVIYEMDSEDEERFLASETDLILGAGATTTINAGRIRGRTRAITAISGGEESDGTESGASRASSGPAGKVKPTVKEAGRAKKSVKGTASKPAGGTRAAPAGRRKANATDVVVDSVGMDAE